MGRPPLRPQPENIREGQQRRRMRATDDKFAVPQRYKMPGVSYEWKTEAVLGAEDPSYMSGLMENGWEAVPLSEMPSFGREGETGAVRRGGQVLMKRPIDLTKEARLEDFQIARDQVRHNTAKLTGTNPGADLPISTSSRVTTRYDAGPGEDDIGIRSTATKPLSAGEMTFDD